MIEYQNLQVEYKTNYINSTVTNGLSILLSKCYKLTYKKSFNMIQSSIKNTKNPIEFLNKLIKNKQL